MPPEIYLVRHGETEWNRAGIWQGALDSPLTPLGIEQAHGLGRILRAHLDPKKPLTGRVSPLGRTVATARIIFDQIPFDFPQFFDLELREISLGAWDGLSREAIGDLPGATEFDWFFFAPGGDSYDAGLARAAAWLAAQSGPVLAVSHGMFGRFIRAAYLGLTRAQTLALPVPQDIVWHLARGRIEALR